MTGRFLIALAKLSFAGGIAALAVILLRLLFRRAPRTVTSYLWLAALFRFVCPVSLSAPFSLYRATVEPVVTMVYDRIQNPLAPSVLEYGVKAGILADTLTTEDWFSHSCVLIWLAGVCVMALASAIRLIRLKRVLAEAVPTENGVWEADHLPGAMVYGIFRPKIYLPSGLEAPVRETVLCHERAHIRRFDPLIKLLFWLALCIHWFNPLAWLAFHLLRRDMELACDETVLRTYNNGKFRADYAQMLLQFTGVRRAAVPTPIAFAEGDLKARIKRVLAWKRYGRTVTVIAVVLSVGLVGAMATDTFSPVYSVSPNTDENGLFRSDSTVFVSSELQTAAESAAMEYNGGKYLAGDVCAVQIRYLSIRSIGQENTVQVGCVVRYGEYVLENGMPESISGSVVPCMLTFRKENGGYALLSYEEAQDGNLHGPSIRRMFGSEAWKVFAYWGSEEEEADGIALRKLVCEHFGIACEEKSQNGTPPVIYTTVAESLAG